MIKPKEPTPNQQPTPAQAARGWVLRRATPDADAMLVRGARKADDVWSFKRGYVYVETSEQAERYDEEFNYRSPHD